MHLKYRSTMYDFEIKLNFMYSFEININFMYAFAIKINSPTK